MEEQYYRNVTELMLTNNKRIINFINARKNDGFSPNQIYELYLANDYYKIPRDRRSIFYDVSLPVNDLRSWIRIASADPSQNELDYFKVLEKSDKRMFEEGSFWMAQKIPFQKMKDWFDQGFNRDQLIQIRSGYHGKLDEYQIEMYAKPTNNGADMYNIKMAMLQGCSIDVIKKALGFMEDYNLSYNDKKVVFSDMMEESFPTFIERAGGYLKTHEEYPYEKMAQLKELSKHALSIDDWSYIAEKDLTEAQTLVIARAREEGLSKEQVDLITAIPKGKNRMFSNLEMNQLAISMLYGATSEEIIEMMKCQNDYAMLQKRIPIEKRYREELAKKKAREAMQNMLKEFRNQNDDQFLTTDFTKEIMAEVATPTKDSIPEVKEQVVQQFSPVKEKPRIPDAEQTLIFRFPKEWIIEICNHSNPKMINRNTGERTKIAKLRVPSVGLISFGKDAYGIDRDSRHAFINMPEDKIEYNYDQDGHVIDCFCFLDRENYNIFFNGKVVDYRNGKKVYDRPEKAILKQSVVEHLFNKGYEIYKKEMMRSSRQLEMDFKELGKNR